MDKLKPLDLTKPWSMIDLAKQVNLIIEHMPILEPVAIVLHDGQEERTLELQEHDGATCWTDVEMENKRREHSLCHSCNLVGVCQIRNQLFDLCCRGDIAAMVTRCKHFQPKEETYHGTRSEPGPKGDS